VEKGTRSHNRAMGIGEQAEIEHRYDPLPRSTVGEAVADRLRRDIKRGSLPPGVRLRQREVAVRFGVSTTPVREAFQLLQAQGLLTIDPHKGAVVAVASIDELIEMYEIRESLEGLAIEKAVPNLTADDLRLLGNLTKQMEQSADELDWVDLNMQFHMQMYKASERPRLCSMVERLRDTMSLYLEDLYTSTSLRKEALQDHRRILKACRRGDAIGAREALVSHLSHTKTLLTESGAESAD
jgi:DNA-binding GntR family transcriptional regulator